MRVTYDIESLVRMESDRAAVRKYLDDAPFFDTGIMHYHDEALQVWRRVAQRYADKESKLQIPFFLAETPKLYALDALCIASPLISDQNQLRIIAELFTVFYLMTHFFDDHVEHPDKFFSKFDFSHEGNLNTQYGAAPFSFLLISFSIIKEILDSASQLTDKSRNTLQNAMYERLAVQTRHFAAERQANLDVEAVLEMKARRVNGQTLGVLADILKEFLKYDTATFERMENGLLYLGSLEQFTDDIRDISIDTMLRNANIIVSANRIGAEAGAKVITELYETEVQNTVQYLKPFYNEADMAAILSLPFYPFMVDKRQLEKGDRGVS